MTVSRNQRTYPLSLTADPLNTGIVAAYDWAAEDGSTTASNGKDHSGNNRHWTAHANTPAIVTTSVGKGRDPSAGGTAYNYYSAVGVSALGLNVGTGDFSVWKRMRMPSTFAGSNAFFPIARFNDTSGALLEIHLYEVASDSGWHWRVLMGNVEKIGWNATPSLPANTVSDLHITRVGGTLKFFVDGVLKKTISGDTTNFQTANGSVCANGPFNTGAGTKNAILIDEIYWSRGLSDAEVAAHRANPYSYYANDVPADSVTVSSPSAGDTVGANIGITGTYAGGTTVTAVEASFNGGAYATISASPTGGNFSGTLTGQMAGTGTLTVRSKNGSTVVATTTVANVTVTANSIAFTVPNTPATAAVPYRMFQRNGSNQASVRITGTYTGTPTAIEYSWSGGAWATLIASPAGGTFDATVTLQGPGQGALAIRFANNPAVTATLASIGVGDVYMVAGQSNHVGHATAYIPAVAPAAHPGWVTTEYDKAGRWRVNSETLAQPFDSIVSGDTTTYPAHATTGEGSYFGVLATKLMELGVPVAFVPCALGSTAISAWAVSTSASQLYGAMLARANTIGGHKAVLWWQGEQDANLATSQAAYESALNAIVNDWCGTRFPGKKWVLMNINNIGLNPANAAVIRAAIANVAATNSNVAGIGDMLGQFSNSIHFGTGGATEVNNVATTAFNAIAGAFYALHASLTLVDASGNPRANLSGLRWAFFDQATPDMFGAPTAKGSGATTNASGVLNVVLIGTALPAGGVGWLEVTDSDGTTTQSPAHKAFGGPVVVN